MSPVDALCLGVAGCVRCEETTPLGRFIALFEGSYDPSNPYWQLWKLGDDSRRGFTLCVTGGVRCTGLTTLRGLCPTFALRHPLGLVPWVGELWAARCGEGLYVGWLRGRLGLAWCTGLTTGPGLEPHRLWQNGQRCREQMGSYTWAN